MTETATVTGLNKVDIQALRQADRISFHRHNGESSVVCTKEMRRAGPFEERERKHEIPCQDTIRAYNGPDGDYQDARAAQCFEMIHSAQVSETWRTIAGLVRAGDEIELEWIANDANGYLKSATSEGRQLYHDKLYLHIRRGGRRALSFYLDDSICPNNTARMIRY